MGIGEDSLIEGDDYADIAEMVNRVFADLSDGASSSSTFAPGSSKICEHRLTGAIADTLQIDLNEDHGANANDLIVVYLGTEIINDERFMAAGNRAAPRYGIDFSGKGKITLKAGKKGINATIPIPLGAAGDVLRVYNRESHRFGWGGSPCPDLPDGHLPPGDDRRVLASYLNGLIERARIMADQVETFGGWSRWSNNGVDPSKVEELTLGGIQDFGAVMVDGIGYFGAKTGARGTPRGRADTMEDINDGIFAVWTEGSTQHLIAAYGWERSIGSISHQSRSRTKSVDLGAASISSGANGVVTVTLAGHGLSNDDMVEFAGLSVGTVAPAKTAQQTLIDLMNGRRFTVSSATGGSFNVTVANAASGTEIAANGLSAGAAETWSAWTWSSKANSMRDWFENDLSFSGSGRTRPRGVLLRGSLTTPILAASGPPYAIVADWPQTGTKSGQMAAFVIDGKIWIATRRLSDQDAAGDNVAREAPILAADFERARDTARAALNDPYQSRSAVMNASAAKSTRSARWGGRTGSEWKTMAAAFETEFESYSAARHFFNRGGEIILGLSAATTPANVGRLIAANGSRRITGKSTAPFTPDTESGFYSLHGEPDTWTLVHEFESAADGLCRITQKHRSRAGKFVHTARVELGHPAETDDDVSISVGYRIPTEVRSGSLRLRGGAPPPVAVSESLVDAAAFNRLAELTNRMFADLHEGSRVPEPYAFKTKTLADVDMSVAASVRDDAAYPLSAAVGSGEFALVELAGEVLDSALYGISGSTITLDSSVNVRLPAAGDSRLRVFAQGTQMYGWGQDPVPPLLAGDDETLRAGYNAVIDRVNIMLRKSGAGSPALAGIGEGTAITAETDALIRSRLSDAILGMRPFNSSAGVVTSASAASSVKRGAFSKAVMGIQWDFPDYAAARHFFNAGGSLLVRPTLSENSAPSWASHFAALDRYLIRWNATVRERRAERADVTKAVGFYHLNETAQELDDAPFKLSARAESVADGRYRVVATIVFEDAERTSSASVLDVGVGHEVPRNDTEGDVSFSVKTPTASIVDPL